MWKLLLIAAILVSAASGQTPMTRHISGIVMDQEGKPLPHVQIDHTGDRMRSYETCDDGSFDLLTGAPAVVFRKGGFLSTFRQNEGDEPVRLVVQASPVESLPACDNTSRYVTVDGWGATLAFPDVRGVTVGQQIRDSDYGGRSYTVRSGRKSKGIFHGAGPM